MEHVFFNKYEFIECEGREWVFSYLIRMVGSILF